MLEVWTPRGGRSRTLLTLGLRFPLPPLSGALAA
jgi:hypothetical protein